MYTLENCNNVMALFTFSNKEYAYNVYVYGFCDGNPRAAVAKYQR
jgi:hypothetical protein